MTHLAQSRPDDPWSYIDESMQNVKKGLFQGNTHTSEILREEEQLQAEKEDILKRQKQLRTEAAVVAAYLDNATACQTDAMRESIKVLAHASATGRLLQALKDIGQEQMETACPAP